jgi:hypothetical protein
MVRAPSLRRDDISDTYLFFGRYQHVLDISRAFDSISWAFLFEVLRHVGFGNLFLKWIATLLCTANTKVIVNGLPGGRIQHARGLRQGDPTSPMLYVIGMQVLTAAILKAVESGLL